MTCTGCGFCQDLGMKFLFDDDLLLVICLEKPVPVEEIGGDEHPAVEGLDARPSSPLALNAAWHEANAMFVYADPTQAVPDPAKLFNGLPYIGLFTEDPRKEAAAIALGCGIDSRTQPFAREAGRLSQNTLYNIPIFAETAPAIFEFF